MQRRDACAGECRKESRVDERGRREKMTSKCGNFSASLQSLLQTKHLLFAEPQSVILGVSLHESHESAPLALRLHHVPRLDAARFPVDKLGVDVDRAHLALLVVQKHARDVTLTVFKHIRFGEDEKSGAVGAVFTSRQANLWYTAFIYTLDELNARRTGVDANDARFGRATRHDRASAHQRRGARDGRSRGGERGGGGHRHRVTRDVDVGVPLFVLCALDDSKDAGARVRGRVPWMDVRARVRRSFVRARGSARAEVCRRIIRAVERGIMDRTPSSVFLQSFQSRAAFVWRIHAMSVSSKIVYRRRLLDVEIAVLAEIVLHAVETAREPVDLTTLCLLYTSPSPRDS